MAHPCLFTCFVWGQPKNKWVEESSMLAILSPHSQDPELKSHTTNMRNWSQRELPLAGLETEPQFIFFSLWENTFQFSENQLKNFWNKTHS